MFECGWHCTILVLTPYRLFNNYFAYIDYKQSNDNLAHIYRYALPKPPKVSPFL